MRATPLIVFFLLLSGLVSFSVPGQGATVAGFTNDAPITGWLAPTQGETETFARRTAADPGRDVAPPLREFRNTDRNERTATTAPTALSGGNYAVAHGTYSGNTSSRIFHRAGCRYYACKRCTVHFPDRNAAVQAGYRPCKVCRP